LSIVALAIAVVMSAGAVYAHDGEDHDEDTTTDIRLKARAQVSPQNVLPVRTVSPIRPDKVDSDTSIKARLRVHDGLFAEMEHDFEDGTHTVSGIINLPTPCHSLETNVLVAESFPEQVTVQFKTSVSAEACAQIIAQKEFEIEFQASEEARIKATLNGSPVNLSPKGDAEDRADNRSNRDGRGEEMRERNDQSRQGRAEAEERRAELKARLDAQKEARIQAFFDRMVARIEAAFERMEKLIERTESRIEKLEERGLDTETSLEFIAEAKSNLADGKAQFESAVDVASSGIADAENPGSILRTLREEIGNAIGLLKSSRESLKNAVSALRAEVSTEASAGAEVDTDDDSDGRADE